MVPMGLMGPMSPMGKIVSRECGMLCCSAVRAGRLAPEARESGTPESCLKTIYEQFLECKKVNGE